MRKLGMTVVALLAVSGLAACSETVDKEGSVDVLVDAGFSQEEAECLVDRQVDAFGDERMLEIDEDPDQMTDAENAEMAELITDCTGFDPNASIPDISIPDISIPDISIPESE